MKKKILPLPEYPEWVKTLTFYKEPLPHYRWSDLEAKVPAAAFANFKQFMTGQTMLSFDGPEGRPDRGVYTWDFQRWLDEGMKDRQGVNWD